MGDFSREPFIRLNHAIKKRYVGVRMQQGVPVLDADWNEMEDLRKHELNELFRQFIGSGVPAGNNGFCINALDNGGDGTIVLIAAPDETGFASLEIDFSNSTAASVLGFLPGKAYTYHYGSSPARLTGNAAEPFTLTEGMTLTVKINGKDGQTVTFSENDFQGEGEDIAAAAAGKVVEIIEAALGENSAEPGEGNDFIITGGDKAQQTGRILVQGVEALNDTDIVYSSQPLFDNNELAEKWDVDVVPPLQTPATGDRDDIVYIDVWEREVDYLEDEDLVQEAIGVETTVRLKREWTVRVAEGANDLSEITTSPGHRYLPLARLHREQDEDKITGESISDLRKLGLNLAKYLKTPIYLKRGTAVLDAERYANILNTLKTILITRLHLQVFPLTTSEEYHNYLLQIAIQDILQQCAFAAVQAHTGNFNNDDGFYFLNILYGLQKEFVQVVSQFGNALGQADAFMTGYGDYLDGSQPKGIPGLKPALDDGDFLSAAVAQESINAWLSQPVNVLPEGSVMVAIASVEPTSNLAYDQSFNITYEVESRATSPRPKEAYEITIETDAPSTWNMALDRNIIEIGYGEKDTVTLTVTPRTGTLSTIFKLTVTSVRNPEITYTNVSGAFEIGSPPPGEEFFLLASPALDKEGRIPIPQSAFDDGQFVFQLTLINTSETEEETFNVRHYVIPPEGQESSWHPIETEASPSQFPLEMGESRTDSFNIFGPVSPSVGTWGTLIAEATLISNGKSASLEYTFIIT